MDKTKTKPEARVTLTITPGQVTPAAKAAWRKFWQKLITEVKAGE
ncbi:MAG: hypothetical protein Q8O55_02360 [Dehalococcoidales bacterium]|nr:hypothetical protein [Dehalococcoidales bacterium]